MDYLLHHLLISSAKREPAKPAVSDGKKTLTFRQWGDRAACLARRLHDAGVRRGDRVAFFLDHNVEQAIAIPAISAAGAVFVPMGATLFPQQVEHILKDSGARVLITTNARRESLGSIPPSCPDLTHVWTVEQIQGPEDTTGMSPVDDTAISHDLAAILYTSGSTGRPKGVMLSHQNLLAGCEIVSTYLKLSAEDRLLGVLPLSFDYGLNQLITMMARGGYYRFLNFAFPEEVVRTLVADRITGLAGVPTVWSLLAHSSLGKTPVPHLRYITNSGGAVPTRILDLLRKALLNTEIYLMYGLTEAFRSTYLPPSELGRRPTSIGKAIPNTEILVISESGQLCGPNEVGELIHRGPTVGLGYWRRPEDTAERYRPHPFANGAGHEAERVVYSGDLVRCDEEGFLYFIGRRDAMIKSAGHRISPTEIEEVVCASGLVKQVAAVGIENSSAGQIIKVYVVPVDDHFDDPEGLGIRIIDHCAANLPQHMVPRFVQLMDSIPRTASGKVDYPALQARG